MLGHAAALALAVAGHGPRVGVGLYLCAFGIPASFAAWSMMFTNYVQHVGCDHASADDHSRNFVSRTMNWLVFEAGLSHGASRAPGHSLERLLRLCTPGAPRASRPTSTNAPSCAIASRATCCVVRRTRYAATRVRRGPLRPIATPWPSTHKPEITANLREQRVGNHLAMTALRTAQRRFVRAPQRSNLMITLLLIVLLIALVGGGLGHSRYGYAGWSPAGCSW